jgi:hypothetical protein
MAFLVLYSTDGITKLIESLATKYRRRTRLSRTTGRLRGFHDASGLAAVMAELLDEIIPERDTGVEGVGRCDASE